MNPVSSLGSLSIHSSPSKYESEFHRMSNSLCSPTHHKLNFDEYFKSTKAGVCPLNLSKENKARKSPYVRHLSKRNREEMLYKLGTVKTIKGELNVEGKLHELLSNIAKPEVKVNRRMSLVGVLVESSNNIFVSKPKNQKSKKKLPKLENRPHFKNLLPSISDAPVWWRESDRELFNYDNPFNGDNSDTSSESSECSAANPSSSSNQQAVPLPVESAAVSYDEVDEAVATVSDEVSAFAAKVSPNPDGSPNNTEVTTGKPISRHKSIIAQLLEEKTGVVLNQDDDGDDNEPEAVVEEVQNEPNMRVKGIRQRSMLFQNP